MRVDITFKRENPEYDQEYADEYHFGKESDNNWRYDFGESYSIDDVKSIELRKKTARVIDGRYQVPKVNTLFCYKENGTVIEVSVSKSLIKKMQKTPSPKKYDILRFYFYLKPVSSNVVRCGGLNFFDVADIPKELTLQNEVEDNNKGLNSTL